jgi:hypothetical protein
MNIKPNLQARSGRRPNSSFFDGNVVMFMVYKKCSCAVPSEHFFRLVMRILCHFRWKCCDVYDLQKCSCAVPSERFFSFSYAYLV